MARKKRSEFAAGLFILLCMAALAGVLFSIQKWDTLFEKPSVYYVQFDNVAGIRPNTDVRVKGQSRGRVAEIQPCWKFDEAGNVSDLVYLVKMELRLEYPLRRNAKVIITPPMIGGDPTINIDSLGSGEAATDNPEQPIVGSVYDMVQAMLSGVGIGQEQREQIQDTIGSASSFMATLDGQGPRISKVMENAEKATDTLREQLPQILTATDETMGSLKRGSAQLESMLTENRDDIRATIANVQKTTAQLQVDLEALMKTANESAANVNAASSDVRTMIAANRLNINSALTNIRLTTEQMKAATAEIHRAPWRLLHRPDERQSDTLNVFDATRNYANAAAELRSTVTTLQSLSVAQQSGAVVSAELVSELEGRLRESLKRYQEAEEALWKLWNEKGPK